MAEDPRLSAARYRLDRLAAEAAGEDVPREKGATPGEPEGSDAAAGRRAAEAPGAERPAAPGAEPPAAPAAPGAPKADPAASDRTRSASALDRAAYVETAIQQAIRRGEFDDLPGAGKPIPDLGAQHDPNWWIRRKIENEKLTGLGPPALRLRVENVELDDRLDQLVREADVREALEDFNRRVIEARRQLLGGPPVVTPTRDVDAEVAAWHRRREERFARAAEADAADAESRRRRRWWRRRRTSS